MTNDFRHHEPVQTNVERGLVPRPRFLVVKLADLGDVLTITPALRALRCSFPDARIDALVTPGGAVALGGLDSVNDLITFEKAQFDRPTFAFEPLRDLANLARRLRDARYSHVFLMHHLFTGFGRAKYAGLLAATSAPFRAGLAERRPPYLTHAVLDRGYGVMHEADYWLEVAGLAGARNPNPRFEIALDEAARAEADALLGPAKAARRVAVYPGSGVYSVARRWPVERYRTVIQRLSERSGAEGIEFVIVGTAAERELAEALGAGHRGPIRNLVGKTGVKTLAAVLARCDLLIGNDGGVMHTARAVNTPVVAVFGPTNHVSWGPYGAVVWSDEAALAPSFVARTDLPCSPCHYRGFLPGTPHGCAGRDCLLGVDPDVVVKAAMCLMNHEGQAADNREGAQG